MGGRRPTSHLSPLTYKPESKSAALCLSPSLVLAAGLTACDSFRDLFSAHADVAAEAGGQKLTPTGWARS